jgi:hypothetical protein
MTDKSKTEQDVSEAVARIVYENMGHEENDPWDKALERRERMGMMHPYTRHQDESLMAARAILALITPAPVAETAGEDHDVAEREAYDIGHRDGYETAVQDLDLATGGDGEFRASSDPERFVDLPIMKQRVIARFTNAHPPAAQDDRLRIAVEALEPFAAFAENVDAEGWTSNIHRERISVWFGPSDFRRAREALAALKSTAAQEA